MKIRLFQAFLALLAVLNTAGCSSNHAKAKLPPPTHPLTQEEALARRQGTYLAQVGIQEKWKADLELDCPQGGRENVIIDSELGRNAFRVSGNRAKRFFFARNMGLVDFSNPYDAPVDIREGGRAIVLNMCPQGRITLVAVLPVDAGFIVGGSHPSATSQDYLWTVERVVGGRHYKGQSQRLQLYINDYQKEKKDLWTGYAEEIDRPLPQNR